MAIVFKPTPIGKPQSAQQIGEWFSTARQQLDDYLPTIIDDLFPVEVLPANRASYKQTKYAEYLAAIEREKRLAEQSLKFAQRAFKMSPEEIAAINKREAVPIDTELDVSKPGRSAKAPQPAMVLEGDIFLPKEQETELRNQFKGANFFSDLKAAGYQMVYLDD